MKRDWVLYFLAPLGKIALVAQNMTSMEAYKHGISIQCQNGRGLFDESLPVFSGKELEEMYLRLKK